MQATVVTHDRRVFVALAGVGNDRTGLLDPELREDRLPHRVVLCDEGTQGHRQVAGKKRPLLGLHVGVHDLGHFGQHFAVGVLVAIVQFGHAAVLRLDGRVVRQQVEVGIDADLGHHREGDRRQVPLPLLRQFLTQGLEAQVSY
ncbi:hypothetical protein D3C76_1391120 [compost metagenome]